MASATLQDFSVHPAVRSCAAVGGAGSDGAGAGAVDDGPGNHHPVQISKT